MRIQHNIMAMNAYRNYNTNNSALSKNLEKLSSGYAINRAGDDAAGLAISEKMRAQITGLDTAQKNAKDGVSLVQTAEGALTEVHDMLNRMVELATQSANGTYENETDRAQLQKEIEQLTDEIDRIADSANFNGIKLLDGNLASEVTKAESALGTADPTLTDGETASEAVKAKITINVSKLTQALTAAAGMWSGVSSAATAGTIEALTIDGTVTVGDLFNVTAGGSSGEFVLEAKTAGKIGDKYWDELDVNAGKLGITATNGSDRGGGAAATKAKYELTFDLTKIQAGDTFQIGSKTFTFFVDSSAANDFSTASTNNIAIDISGLDAMDSTGAATSNGQLDIAVKIQNAINTAFSGSYDIQAAPTSANDLDSGKYTISFKAKNEGTADDMGQIRILSGGAVTGTYTAGKEAGEAGKGSFAKVQYDFDLNKLAAGDVITIGGKKVEIVEDSADADKAAGKITLSQATGTTLTSIFEGLGYDSGKLEFANGKLTITGTTEGESGSKFASSNAAKVSVGIKSTDSSTGGLTLQIGDTSDSFNQLNVSIDDMHAKSLGISNIDIGTQEGAQDAIEVIKNAINSVSDVRGTLGATQNRLDHTMNNLSVMEENIQDAESTIRDTDVAEEMMAYTKNNILVQSAQAMLAQANQVPQGVLQLLG